MKSKNVKNLFHLNTQEQRSILIFTIVFFTINLVGWWADKDPEIEILRAGSGIAIDSISASFHSSDQPEKVASKPEEKSVGHKVTPYSEKKISYSTKEKQPIDFSDNLPVQKIINSKTEPKTKKEITLTGVFDPNTSSKEKMIEIGVPKKIAKNIYNYVQSGGSFHKKKDLLKIYTIDEKSYSLLEPFISLSKKEKEEPLIFDPIDINAADLEDWKKLKGIGPYYAGKIMRFRDKLGGFYSVDQIKETWDLPSEVIEDNKNMLQLNQKPIKIELEQADFKMLVSHPYIDRHEARLLLKLKNITDKIDNRVFLDIFDEEKWEIMKNYIAFNIQATHSEHPPHQG